MQMPIRGNYWRSLWARSPARKRSKASRAPRVARRHSRCCSWRPSFNGDDNVRCKSSKVIPMALNDAPSRRQLLLAGGTLFAWAYMPKLARAEGRDPRLLVIVLREGNNPALPLDSFFALNPAMPNLHRLYRSGAATIVHASATPYRERSHFDGQDVLESGLSAPGAAESGWLNRALL